MKWMNQQLTPVATWEEEINTILAEKLDLPDLQWEIDQTLLTELLAVNQRLSVEHVLDGVLHAILNNSLGYFALWHVSRNQRLQKTWINGGKLRLLDPLRDKEQLTPGCWKDETEWLHFTLEVPRFSPIQLIIYIRLDSPSAYGFCKSLIKRELALASSLEEIVAGRLSYRELVIGKHWEWAEEEEQGLLDFSLGWRDAFYLALSDGVRNQESDITFQTAFLWEDWYELEGFEGISGASRAFLKSASVHYIPRPYKALAVEDEILAKVPKEAKLDFDNFWYFLLLSEQFPDRRIISYCRKSGDGIEDAWHDLYYVDDEVGLGIQINHVIQEEFELSKLEVLVEPEEFERQKSNCPTAWRPTKTIFRQLINCLLKDESSEGSFMQRMESPAADLSAAPAAFTMQAKAKFYLNRSKIQLRSIEATEGPQIRKYWIFTLETPALVGQMFEVYIPRFPDFEAVDGLPYNKML